MSRSGRASRHDRGLRSMAITPRCFLHVLCRVVSCRREGIAMTATVRLTAAVSKQSQANE